MLRCAALAAPLESMRPLLRGSGQAVLLTQAETFVTTIRQVVQAGLRHVQARLESFHKVGLGFAFRCPYSLLALESVARYHFAAYLIAV